MDQQCHHFHSVSPGCCYVCCWPYLKYIIATRLGETPFMALIPCAVFALRIKVRTLFGIKVSLYVQINYTFIYTISKFCKYSP